MLDWGLRGAIAGYLLCGGCFYSFQNPVDLADGGSVFGQVALSGALAGQTLAGGNATLQFTGLSVTLDATGRFAFLDLPDGTYALQYGALPLMANDLPPLGYLPAVQLPRAVNGQPDALNLGALPLLASGLITGSVSGANGPVVVAAFVPGDAGLGAYEGFFTWTDSDGGFQLALPAGSHTVAASDATKSATSDVRLAGGDRQTLNLPLAPALSSPLLAGNLVLDGNSLGADAPTAAANAYLSFVQYQLTTDGGPVGSTAALNSSPQNVGLGSAFALSVPPGQLVTLGLSLSPGVHVNGAGEALQPVTFPELPIIAGQTTFLPQLTWLSPATCLANGGCQNQQPASPTTGTTGASSSGSTTGGSSSGGTGGGARWLDAGDLLVPDPLVSQVAVAPLGALGQALIWTHGSNPSSADLFYAEDRGLGFGAATPLLLDAGIQSATLSVAAGDGGTAIAWITSTNTVAALFAPVGARAAPSVSSPFGPGFVNPGGDSTESVALVAGQRAGVPGVFVLTPSPDGGLFATFSADGLTTFDAPSWLPLATDGGGVLVAQIAATACAARDLDGGEGFCVLGTDGRQGGVSFAQTLSSASAALQVIDTQTFPTPLDLGNPSNSTFFAAIATSLDGQSLALSLAPAGAASEVASFQSLQTPLTLQTNATANLSLVLPWRGEFLGMASQSTQIVAVSLSGSPSAPPLQGEVASQNGAQILHGYADPSSGSPVLAATRSQAGGGTLLQVLLLSP